MGKRNCFLPKLRIVICLVLIVVSDILIGGKRSDLYLKRSGGIYQSPNRHLQALGLFKLYKRSNERS